MNFTSIDWKKLEVPELKESETQKGYKSCNPTYEGKALQVQFPLAYLPFGASPPSPANGIEKWSLPVGRDENGSTKPIIGALFAKFEAFDEHLIDHAFEHSLTFFGSQKKRDIIAEFMNKTIKVDKNAVNAAKYGPRLQPTLAFDKETEKFTGIVCEDVDGSPLDIEKISKRSKGFVTVRLGQIYSVGGKAFGATWYVTRIKVMKHSADEAPPIQQDMYGEDPELDAILLAMPMPVSAPVKVEDMYPETDHIKSEEPKKRERSEEEPEPESKSKKSKGKGKK